MNWSPYSTSDPSPLTVIEVTTDYTAADEDFVIADCENVTLPSPVVDGVIGLRQAPGRGDVRVTATTGQVAGYSAIKINSSRAVFFVSDGSAWHVVADEREYAVIQ
jgi:hypothetical protein